MKSNQLKHRGSVLAACTEDYHNLLKNICSVIEEGRRMAVRQINVTLTATYWLVGMSIVEYEQGGKERAGYGEETLKDLSRELKRKYGNGFSFPQLKNIRQFYLTYREGGFRPSSQVALRKGYTLSSQFPYLLRDISAQFPLTWSHYCLLMRIEDTGKRRFYENLSLQGHWSVRHLDREINALLYERTAISKRKDLLIAKANANAIILRPEDEVKDSYVLDFLGLKNEYSESDLEDSLIRHLENFLLELGRGFAFVARQKRFILDGDEYRIDLLLFNIPLACYVILEIKVGRFTHSNAGQINFYVNWVKENIQPPAQNDPIGIILCSDRNTTTVRYATGGLSNKIFVSKYLLQLPKPEDLQRELERGRTLFLEHQAAAKNDANKILLNNQEAK